MATHAAVWDPSDLEQRIDTAQQVVTMAAASHSPELEMGGFGWLTVDLLEAGDLRGSDDARHRHAVLARSLQHRLGLRDTELWTAMRSILDGRFDDAAIHIERARDLGETARDPATDSIYWVHRYWLAVERETQSEMDELVEPCERIIATNPDVPAWRAALAMLHARRGDQQAATTSYEPLAADQFRGIPRDVVWLNAMTYLAETCSYLGDAENAPLLVHTLEPYASRVALIDRAFACKGSIQRFLGLLAAVTGDSAEAEGRLTLALACHQQMGALPLIERTQHEVARL